MNNKTFIRSAVGAASATLCLYAAAQSAGTLSEVTVTANPLGTAERIAPVERVDGPELLLRADGNLGETLDGLPGVSSTHFGPNVSRPVLRGLDGDRIRILRNGGATIDASGLSFDHAVPLEPIAVERIEVLRGPGALLYGGSAIGGVVNVIDNRIPRSPLQGVTGRVDAGLATGSREKFGAAMLEAGNGRQVLHVDAFGRDAGDVRVPRDLDCTQAGVTRSVPRICNTFSQSQGAAVGGTNFFERGYLGASVSTYRNDYGSAAEEEVAIDMKSDRLALEGLWRPVAGPFQGIRLQAGHTDYQHTEFDAGEPGTLFRNQGNDLRMELRHRPIGNLSGMLGVQAEHSRFSADGDEAFAPYSRTRQRAVFLYEELATNWGRVSFGARREDVRVESLGNPTVDRFATGVRRFEPTSYALGALWKLSPQWQATANLAHSERAPRDYELFANGPHVATGAFETGDPSLGLERSNNLDLGVAWKNGPNAARASVFVNRFSNYIALESTGVQQEVEPGEFLPGFAWRDVRATLRGLEAAGTWRLLHGARTVDLEWRGDLVRATNETTDQPLPRIPPARLGAALAGAQGPWTARLGLDHAARQDRVPAGERATPGYTLWHAALTRRAKAGAAELLWYARLDNLTDVVARPATSILTQTAPERALLAGRSLRVGVRADF